ncbi:MAG: DUF6055 domain-containing protein [Verrucomicrobiota bacterium]
MLAALFSAASAGAQSPPAFRYGAEPVFVPSEMPPVVRKWNPTNKLNEPGIRKGTSFEAALVRVFNEDTPWSAEIAVFRLRDGTVRAWKARSFSDSDRRLMREMRAKTPVPPADKRKWTTRLSEQYAKLVKDGQLHQHETPHFVFIWGNKQEGEVKNLMSSPQFIEKAGEWFEKVWASYEVDAQAPMPYADSRKPERILVKLYNTGIPGVGDGYANAAKEMAITPIAIRYGSTVVGHEFCHVVQAYTGGFMIRSSVGPWWETHAEAGSFSYSPTHGDSLGNMFSHLHHGCQWPESRYSNWAIVMHLWEKQRTRHLVYGIWTKNRRGDGGASEEDPIETTVRLGKSDGSLPKGWESFTDEIGEMAARMVTMDYIHQGFLLDASAGMRKSTMSQVTPAPGTPGWYASPADKPLYAYGAHWLPVRKQPGEKTITISFRGASKANDATWQLTLVGVDGENVARYSPRVTATGDTQAEVRIDVKPGEDYVLTVAATPTKYRPLTWDQTPEFSFPYLVKATGGTWETPPAARSR